jgi:hypothetical protein
MWVVAISRPVTVMHRCPARAEQVGAATGPALPTVYRRSHSSTDHCYSLFVVRGMWCWAHDVLSRTLNVPLATVTEQPQPHPTPPGTTPNAYEDPTPGL